MIVCINYKGFETSIICNYDWKIRDIIEKFCEKIDEDKYCDSMIFLYSGKKLNKKSKLRDIIQTNDKNSNRIDILAFISEEDDSYIKYKNNIIYDTYKIIIYYLRDKIEIKANPDDKMGDILEKYCSMTKINKNSIYLFFQEKIIYEGLKVKEFRYAKEGVIELEAKNRNLISIKATNQIICPICGEAAEFQIENCRVTIVGCKNNHRISNINFNTFEETQLTDFSKIKCKKCGWTFKNDENIKLNYCFTCNYNYCSGCDILPYHKHKLGFNYIYRFNFCDKHQKKRYNFFCKTCEECLCYTCQSSHENHDICLVTYAEENDMMGILDKLKKSFRLYKNKNFFKLDIINEKLDDLNNFLNFCSNVIKHYDPKNYNNLYVKSFINLKKKIFGLIKEIDLLNKTGNNNYSKIYDILNNSPEEPIKLENENKSEEIEMKNKENIKETANDWKNKGNELVKEKKYKYALDCYTKAIDIDPNDPILYSNRSAMYYNLNQFEDAILDAEKAISLKHDYVKAYLRKGKALEGQHKIKEAYDTYKLGLEKCKTNEQLLEASQELEALINNPFLENYPKLYTDPRTATLMLDPQFRQLIDLAMKDNNIFRQYIQSDPRFLTVLSVLSGLDLNQMNENLNKQSEEKKKEEEIKRKKDEEKYCEGKNKEFEELERQYKLNINALEKQCREYENTIREYDAKIKVYKDNYKDIEKKIERYENTLSSNVFKIDDLENKNKQYMSQISNYKNNIIDYEKKEKENEIKMKEYENKISDNNNKIKEYEQKFKDYENKRINYENKIKDNETKFKEYENKITDYKTNIKEYETKIKDKEDKIIEKENIIKDNETKIKEYENKIIDYEANIKEYENKIKDNENKIKDNETKIKEYDSKIIDNENKAKDYDKKINDYETTIKEYKNKIIDYETKIKEYENKKTDKENKITDKENKIVDSEKEKDKIIDNEKIYVGDINKIKSDEKIQSKIIDNENNKIYESKIIEYENQISDYKNKILKMEKSLDQKTEEVKELNEKIKTTNTGINKKYDTEKVLDLMEEINKKNKEIELIRASFPIQIKSGEKLMTVIFVSGDQAIHYALICKNTDIFSTLEIKLYEIYPVYKESENYFLINGKKINKYKSLEKNGIKNSDIITLVQLEE